MVGLSEIDEFEVETEGPCELIGSGEIKGTDAGQRLLKVRGSGGLIGGPVLWGFGLAPGDGSAAKGFDRVVERVTGLLS
jgi:hypothetical protein